MLPALINPLPLVFTLVTTFGVLVHDTQIDRATTLAVVVPASYATFAALDTATRLSDDHIHVERFSTSTHLASLIRSVPRIQPRDEDDHHYIQSKKVNFGSNYNGYLWPSV
ncbi:MAG: hypothetical protein ABIP50_00605 [Candidatus Saccharimonadales bacterium]